MPPSPVEVSDEEIARQLEVALLHWAQHPVDYVCDVIGVQPDPWQCDVMDAIMLDENVAVRACHGVGKSALLSWVIQWFTVTRAYCKVPTTAPTFNKQVRDILWAEVHTWWHQALKTSPWLDQYFELRQTRLQRRTRPEDWFAVGIASSQPLNIEGYHAPHLLAIFDEAKSIPKPVWDAIHGMRTTQEGKLLCASTPGGPLGEFYNVFTKYRKTWKSLFVIHPECLRGELKRPEAPPYSRAGTYYSNRVRPQWVEQRAQEWGKDSPVFIARAIGDFPSVEGDVLIPYTWIAQAEDREDGVEAIMPYHRLVACDVARYGRDRTVMIVGEGGTLLHGETMARTIAESTAPEAREVGVGDDPKRPLYRATVVTADACQRLRQQWDADAIVIDETGLGGGVVDDLRRRGERVIPINFGAAPTDRPKSDEEAKLRRARHLLDSRFVNLKAQMGWALRGAFEVGAIALARLNMPGTPYPRAILDPLTSQCSLVKQEMDAAGRMRIIDPDDQDVLAAAAAIEGHKSPDHFHALLLYWWIAGGLGRPIPPRAGQPEHHRIPSTVARIGERVGRENTGQRGQIGRSGGQTQWVRAAYGLIRRK